MWLKGVVSRRVAQIPSRKPAPAKRCAARATDHARVLRAKTTYVANVKSSPASPSITPAGGIGGSSQTPTPRGILATPRGTDPAKGDRTAANALRHRGHATA